MEDYILLPKNSHPGSHPQKRKSLFDVGIMFGETKSKK